MGSCYLFRVHLLGAQESGFDTGCGAALKAGLLGEGECCNGGIAFQDFDGLGFKGFDLSFGPATASVVLILWRLHHLHNGRRLELARKRSSHGVSCGR